MNVFITGADGFIGSHLTEKLVKLGHNVKALVIYNSLNKWGWLEVLDKDVRDSIQVIEGDIRDYDSLVLNLNKSEAVFHLAALISIPYSYVAPKAFIETNVNGTMNVLRASLVNQVSQVIHTSTSEVYGTAIHVPMSEDHPIKTQSPYSASKAAADNLVYAFSKSFNLQTVTIRPFNTYGPRQSAKAIIPSIIIQLLKSNQIKVGNLNTSRDFTFVDDTVNGFIKALSYTKKSGEVFNLGTKFEISIKDLTKIISKLMNIEFSFITENKRIRPAKSEVDQLCADNSYAKKELNWTPNYADLIGLGLQKTIDWFSLKENLANYKSDTYNI